jgi:hypothetical protein
MAQLKPELQSLARENREAKKARLRTSVELVENAIDEEVVIKV